MYNPTTHIRQSSISPDVVSLAKWAQQFCGRIAYERVILRMPHRYDDTAPVKGNVNLHRGRSQIVRIFSDFQLSRGKEENQELKLNLK